MAAIAVGAMLAASPLGAADPPRTPAANVPDLAVGAALDLASLYRAALSPGDPPSALVARLDAGLDELRRAKLVGNRDADLLLEAAPAENAALLLRMHTLEAVACASGHDLDGVRLAARAESLQAALRLQMDEIRPAPEAFLPVVAGLRPSRAELERVLPFLEASWRQGCAAEKGSPGGAAAYLLLHALADRNPASLALAWRPGSRDSWDTAIVALGTTLRTGRLRGLVIADDPLRRLRLGLRALVVGGVIPATALDHIPADLDVASDAALSAARAGLDSIAAMLDEGQPRASPILGSRRNYYRRTGDEAPSLEPEGETLSRDVALAAIAALRVRLDASSVTRAGIQVSAEVEPVEVVPGQQVEATWTLAPSSPGRLECSRVSIAGIPATLRDPTVELAPGQPAVVRTGFVALPAAPAGTVQALDLELEGTLGSVAGVAPVALHDRVTVRVVAPVQATLAPVGDPLLDGGHKSVDAIVTSRSPHPIRGTLRVLATSDWKIGPARAFGFALLRPGQSARARIELDLPRLASPGPYELRVGLDVDGEATGILATRLVKPLEWVVVGPFDPPGRGSTLPPERGANLATRYKGQDGNQVAWRVAPRDAFDADGRLMLDSLFPGLQRDAAACAMTVLESPEAGPALLEAPGAARVLWNGAPVRPDGRIRIESGRNTLLARCLSGAGGWRLDLRLSDSGSGPLRVLANDLARLLDGYAELEKAPPIKGGQPPDRIVLLSFRGASPAQDVAVIGTFNAWVPLELERQPDGTWQRQLRLAPGRYAYKLLVDGRLRPDPAAPSTEPDGFGGRNSLLIVR